MNLSTATIVGQTMTDPGMAVAISVILGGVLKLVLLAVAGLVGRLINTKINVENSTWKQKLAFRLVCYAENKITDDTNKQAYVSRELSKILKGRVDPEEIQHLIEEAVTQLIALTHAPK